MPTGQTRKQNTPLVEVRDACSHLSGTRVCVCVCVPGLKFTCGSPDDVNWSHQKEDFSLPSLQSAKEKKQLRSYIFTPSHFSINVTFTSCL